jgi:hypothetical protein
MRRRSKLFVSITGAPVIGPPKSWEDRTGPSNWQNNRENKNEAMEIKNVFYMIDRLFSELLKFSPSTRVKPFSSA